MIELINILKYRLLWLNFILVLLTAALSFFYADFAALLFVLLSNLFDILGYHFALIRRTNQLPEKVIIRSYRVNQFMFDLLLLILIAIQFSWIAALSGFIMKWFGLQDILYYLFLQKELPELWTWMKWTPFGAIKGNLNRFEIIIQAITGMIIAILILLN